MADFILYTNPMSRGRMTRWMIEETGLNHTVEIVGYGPDMNSAAYLALNPMGKVPCLVHGEAVVTEVAAICAYLADAATDVQLCPPVGSAKRGAYYRWMFFAGPLEAAVLNQSLGVTLKPEQEGRAGYGSLARITRTLEHLLSDGRPYLLGDSFSAVDVVLGSQIGWSMQFGAIPETAPFADYWARILARPARQRATAADDALIPPDGPKFH